MLVVLKMIIADARTIVLELIIGTSDAVAN